VFVNLLHSFNFIGATHKLNVVQIATFVESHSRRDFTNDTLLGLQDLHIWARCNNIFLLLLSKTYTLFTET
jgi:hypothetical protein